MPQLTLAQVVQLASDQFNVKNATENILTTQKISSVFSPPYHGPRNVPICGKYRDEEENAKNLPKGNNVTHFPIVAPRTYYLFLKQDTDEVQVEDMHYNGPSQQLNDEGNRYLQIELTPIDKKDLKGSPFKQGFHSESDIVFNQGDPQPIAIHFKTSSGNIQQLDYIVV
jgi:hypothetical protein